MRYDPALAEAYPLPDRPSDPADALVAEGVPAVSMTDEILSTVVPAAETEQETSVEPLTETGKGDVMRPLIRRRRAAHEAGRRIVRRASPRKRGEHAHSDVVEIYWGERRRKGGGGSWLIREHMRKLEAEAKARAEAEAESHESNCDCPLHDALAA